MISLIDKKILENNEDLLVKLNNITDIIDDLKDIFKDLNSEDIGDEKSNEIIDNIKTALSLSNYSTILATLLQPFNETNYEIMKQLEKPELLDEFNEYVTKLSELTNLLKQDGEKTKNDIYNLNNLSDTVKTKDLINNIGLSSNYSRDMFVDILVDVLTKLQKAKKLLEDSSSTDIIDLNHKFLENITDYIKDKVHTLNNTILNYITDRLFDINDDKKHKLNNTEAIKEFHKTIMEIIDSYKDVVDSIELKKAPINESIYNIIQTILDLNSSLVINQTETNKLTDMYEYSLQLVEKVKTLNGTELVKLQEEFIDKLNDKMANFSDSFNSTVINKTFDLLFELNSVLKDKLNNNGTVDKFKEFLADLIDMEKKFKKMLKKIYILLVI